MSDNQTLTTLNRTEAQILQAFIWQVDTWQSQYGEKADTVEIVYFPEDEGFDVFNNEPSHGIIKRTRTTVFRADIIAWANNQLKQLQGFGNENTVTAFVVSYKNGEYGVLVEAVPTASLGSETEPKDESANENQA
ncbi:hypothetical protein [Moraxella equi]|uniref:Uncharacterized protein n=1 Tax=Moraxella equi TaxID=60442 RepID=A0A378QUK8_9GAMM|nr:hypothetical protein [Moraxella equi]OPH38238.1 hypothetical protein B5J93_06700 [Moraxella equi]STZ03103.1 Uncharacterised protein [Moraxella equi]